MTEWGGAGSRWWNSPPGHGGLCGVQVLAGRIRPPEGPLSEAGFAFSAPGLRDRSGRPLGEPGPQWWRRTTVPRSDPVHELLALGEALEAGLPPARCTLPDAVVAVRAAPS